MISLSKQVIQNYNREGIIKIKLPQDIITLKYEFLEDCCKFLKYWAKFDTTPQSLSMDLVKLAKENRSVIGKLYKVSERFPACKKISSHPYFIQIAKQLMNTSLISCYHLTTVRMDLPTEEKFLMPAHQDFPYIQGSINGITIYFGFSNLTSNHGLISYKEASHINGIIKVTEGNVKLNDINKNNLDTSTQTEIIQTSSKTCEIADPSVYENVTFINEDLKYDEAFVFHTLLLHRSKRNRSDSARITLQFRFDDLMNKDSHDRDFPEGRSQDDLFGYNFPEFVVNGD